MEELRQTALAYYKDAPQHIKRSVDECFVEMDVDGNDRVSRQEFLAYMEMHEDCKHLSTCSFFNELKEEEKEELDFVGVVTLVYIIYSGKPFCNGHCGSFIKGMYFTCVKCCDGHEHGQCIVSQTIPSTFALLVTLMAKLVHGLKLFLDNFVLLQTKRMEAFKAAYPLN